MHARTLSLKIAKHIWIYGAGFIGSIVADKLIKRGISIDGFVVTKNEEKRDFSNGIRIVELKSIALDSEDTFFVLAVDDTHINDVTKNLLEKGYVNYILWKDIDMEEYWKSYPYHFCDRRRGMDKVCFVLGGYKDFLWDSVLGRLKRYVPCDVDVCLLTSGKYVKEIDQIAKDENWSYLYTELNSVTYIQNIAISVFNNVSWIYKMDEDMFLTEGSFERLFETYHLVERDEPYHVGFVAPLIPVNGYGQIRILDHLGKREDYEKQFDRVLFGCHPDKMLEYDLEAAKYMWGVDGNIPYIDELNRVSAAGWQGADKTYSFCNIRFSIGFILFKKRLWNDMWGFSVSGNPDMGVDEEEICMYCMKDSLAIVVAENSVVGHFSFGGQTSSMREFYLNHKDFFSIR